MVAEAEIYIHRAEHSAERKFCILSRETLQNRQLTFEARGVLGYILSKPIDWKVQPRDLQQKGCGRDKVYRILTELEEAKYIEREYIREKGIVQQIIYRVYEEPFPEKPETVKPETAKPYRENQGITVYRESQNIDSTEESNTSPNPANAVSDRPITESNDHGSESGIDNLPNPVDYDPETPTIKEGIEETPSKVAKKVSPLPPRLVGSFNPTMLQLAIDVRSQSIASLVDATGINGIRISAFLSGSMKPVDADIDAMAKALDFPPPFFFREGSVAQSFACSVDEGDLDPNAALDLDAEIVEGQRTPPAVPIRGIEAVRRSASMMTPDEVRALPAFDVDLANAVVSAQEQRNEMLAEEGYSDLPVPRSWQVGDRVSWKWQPRGGYGPAYLPAGVVIGLTRQQIKILVYESAKSEFQEKTVKAESLLPRENESQPLDAEAERRIAAAGKAKKPALAKAYSNKDVYNAFAEVFFGAADDVEAKAVGGRVGPMREQLVKHVLDKRKESDLSEDAIAVLCAHIRAFGAWWDKNKIDKKTGVPLTRPQHWNSLSPAWLEYCKSPEAQAIGKPIVAMKPCPTCHGQAVIYSGNTGTPCRDCGGKGKVQA